MIYNVLTNADTKGNPNHPAMIMWKDREAWLLAYCFEICHEWQQRGYRDDVLEWCICQMPRKTILTQEYLIRNQPETMPTWLGAPALHQSHRSRLVTKDWEHYVAKLGWRDRPGGYFWPGSSAQFRENYGVSGLYTTVQALSSMSMLAQQTPEQLQLLLS